MTRYRLDRDPDTGKPCMVADPEGIYYSAGEADRKIAERESLIRRMANALGEEKLRIGTYPIIGGARNCGKTFAMKVFSEEAQRRAMLVGGLLWEARKVIGDEAGTHDGGTVPEGDRSSTGPASARESEGHSE